MSYKARRLPIARMMWRLLWAATSLAAAGRSTHDQIPGWRCGVHDRPVSCLDLSTCRRGAARRKAIVSVFDAHADTSATLHHFVKHRERLAKSARAAGVDSIFVLPRRDLQAVPFPEANMKLMKKAGIDIRYSDWVVPPNLSKGVPVESGGCCGAREFLKFVPMGYDEYDAIMVVDNDYDLDDFGKFGPLFDCAADGHVITTRAPMSMVNGALLVVPPSRSLRDALLDALSTATVDYTGWNKTPWGPLYHRSDMRVQGFFYWFFYQQYDALTDRRWRPAQVDPCVWNVQEHLAPMCRAELCGNLSLGSGHVDGLRKYRRGLC